MRFHDFSLQCLAVFILFLMAACSSPSDQTGTDQVNAKKSSDSPVTPDKPLTKTKPKESAVTAEDLYSTQSVHALATIGDGVDTITYETFAWCEKMPVPASAGSQRSFSKNEKNQGFYCIEHEVGRLQQGANVHFITRTLNRRPELGKAFFESNLSESVAKQLWEQTEGPRLQTPSISTKHAFDIRDYRQFLLAEKSLLLSRCRDASVYPTLANKSLSDEGMLTLSGFISALTLRVPETITILEINPDTFDFAAISTDLDKSDELGDPTRWTPSSGETESTLSESDFASQRPYDQPLSRFKPRDDRDIRQFAAACANIYFKQNTPHYAACGADSDLYGAGLNEKAEAEAKILPTGFWKNWPSIPRRDSRGLDLNKSYWKNIPPYCTPISQEAP